MIKFDCGKCGQTYKVKDELAGRKTKCRKCEALMAIPAAEAEIEAEWVEEDSAAPDNAFEDESEDAEFDDWDGNQDADWEDEADQLPTRRLPGRKGGTKKKKKVKAAPAPEPAEVSMKPLVLGALVGFLPVLILGLILVVMATSGEDPVQARLQELAMDAIQRTKPSLSPEQQQQAAFDVLVDLRLMLRKHKPYSELIPATVRAEIPADQENQIVADRRIAEEQVPAMLIKDRVNLLNHNGVEKPLLLQILLEDVEAGKAVTTIDSKIAVDLISIELKEARS